MISTLRGFGVISKQPLEQEIDPRYLPIVNGTFFVKPTLAIKDSRCASRSYWTKQILSSYFNSSFNDKWEFNTRINSSI